MGQRWLILAFVASLAWLALGVVAMFGDRRRPSARAVTVAGWATVVAAGGAVAALGIDLVRVDDGSLYVQRFASDRTPLVYRLAGLWGGMEGSLLWWSFLVAIVFVLAARHVTGGSDPPWQVVAAASTASFLFVSWRWASPFEQIDVPTGRGAGLPAILQHPAMLYHPPLLYGGLVLLGVPYASTLVAVWQRRLDRDWLATITPWLRASWVVLGAGMLAGSRWAYAELGWGGFWAWDPVENAALIPWLLTTVALHASMVVRRSGRTSPTTALLVIAAYVAMTIGVYVTRSGGSGSIHAFAESADVGRALVVVAGTHLVVAVGGLLSVRPTSWRWRRIGREPALLGHVVLMAFAVLGIAAATFGPVLVELFGGRRTVIRPDYYVQVLGPLAVLVLAGMAVGPALQWSGGMRRPWRLGFGTALGGITGGLAIVVLPGGTLATRAFVVVAAAAVGAAAVTLVPTRHASPGAALARRGGVGAAHAGFALMLAAAAGASLGSDTSVIVRVGEVATVGDETVRLVALDSGKADRYEYVRADVRVGDGHDPPRFHPELRAYDDQRVPTAEASFRGTALGETIVVMSALTPDAGGARFEVLRRPLMPLVWWGALLMLGGGCAAALAAPRATRRTARAAARSRAATAAPPPEGAVDADATSTTPLPDPRPRAPAPP